MKIVKIEGQYNSKTDFVNLLKILIKEIESDDIIHLQAEYESNFGGKLVADIKNVELPDLRQKITN